jgi:hypothetical protein
LTGHFQIAQIGDPRRLPQQAGLGRAQARQVHHFQQTLRVAFAQPLEEGDLTGRYVLQHFGLDGLPYPRELL